MFATIARLGGYKTTCFCVGPLQIHTGWYGTQVSFRNGQPGLGMKDHNAHWFGDGWWRGFPPGPAREEILELFNSP